MTANGSRTDDEIQRAVVDRVREVQVAGGDPISEELVEDVDLEDGVVTFTVVVDRLDRLMVERVTDQLRGAGLATAGVDHVRVEAADPGVGDGGLTITGVDTLIAVASAKGGVGKTTITVALAKALTEAGLNVGVFDANVYAPDVPDRLDAEGPVHQTPSGRPKPVDADGIEVLSLELIADDGPVAWRGAMVHEVVSDLLGDAVWDDRDVLLVDLPPGIGDAVYTIVQQARIDGALLVTTPTDASVRATERTGALFTANDVETIGVVPNMVGEDGPYDATATGLQDAITEDAVAEVESVPFDPALREPLERSFTDLDTDGAAAIAALGETVKQFWEANSDPEPPADAVDVRGLPPSAGHQQAITEFDRDPDGTVSVLTRGEPRELAAIVRENFERDGRDLSVSMTDLGRNGWLVELEADEPEAMSESAA
ncbi:P-loop NTPase [Halopiger goleimassiliensis]|uniref:P-loop NTPase n=1 Tax=Halopiger goleimassiliensis TaxID=1293048 RepID=UPI000677893F|nr:P-loop NTPase [Halopiger goleimassiliensis]